VQAASDFGVKITKKGAARQDFSVGVANEFHRGSAAVCCFAVFASREEIRVNPLRAHTKSSDEERCALFLTFALFSSPRLSCLNNEGKCGEH